MTMNKAMRILNLVEDDWAKETQEKARNAIEYGKLKGYNSITNAGLEVLKMVADGKGQEEVLQSKEYAVITKVWGK